MSNWMFVFMLILLLIFLIFWSKLENVDGSVTSGLIIWFIYVLYAIFGVSIFSHYQSIKSDLEKLFIWLTIIPFSSILIMCFVVIKPENIDVIDLLKETAVMPFFFGIILTSGNLLRILIKYDIKKKTEGIKLYELIIAAIFSFFLSGVGFAFIYYVDDTSSKRSGKGASIRFIEDETVGSKTILIDSAAIYFQEASSEFISVSENIKLDSLVNLIMLKLINGKTITIELDSYADKRPLAVPNDKYPSNFELTIERSNRIKNYFLKKTKDKDNRFSRQLLFVDTRHTSEVANASITPEERKVEIKIFDSTLKPKFRDYLLFSFAAITQSNNYLDIQPINKSCKIYLIIENIFNIFYITILLGLGVAKLSEK